MLEFPCRERACFVDANGRHYQHVVAWLSVRDRGKYAEVNMSLESSGPPVQDYTAGAG